MNRLNLENTLLDERYELLRCLAQGSYAEIFVARDRLNSQSVIVKALNTALQGTPEPELERMLIENFENEALVLDTVRHPHIVRRLGHGTALDVRRKVFHYLVLEYLAGGNLLDYCRSHGPLSLEETLYFFQQIVEALAHAHESRIIHRDLKPSNLLLSEDFKTIKIADFGVAKMGAEDSDEITRVGTNLYAPPEHHPDFDRAATANMRLTAAADIYALAKTLYTVMSGQSPQAYSGRPITGLPPTLMHSAYSRELLRVLGKATASEIAERYPDVEAFWTDFTQLAEWQADEETRVRTRPARSAPLEIPEAVSAPHFLPASRDGSRRPEAENPATPSPAFIHRPPVPKPAGRIVISLGQPAPSTVEIPKRTPALLEAALKESEPAALLAGKVPAATLPLFTDQGTPSLPEPQPPQASQQPNVWQRVLTPSVIGVLVTGMLVIGFIATMVVIYRTTRTRFLPPGASSPWGGGSTSGASTPGGFFAVTKTGVNVRMAPNATEDNVLGTLGKGVRVEVLEVQGRWYHIRTTEWVERRSPDITEGWAYGQFFEKE